MHDVRAIRADAAAFDAAMARRGLAPVAAEILGHDESRRAALAAVQERQARRNAIAREIGQARKAGADTASLETEALALREEIAALEAEAEAAEARQAGALERLPNRLDPEVPDGPDESGNLVLHVHGTPRPAEGARQHFDIGEALGEMDFARAAKLAGGRTADLHLTLRASAKAVRGGREPAPVPQPVKLSASATIANRRSKTVHRRASARKSPLPPPPPRNRDSCPSTTPRAWTDRAVTAQAHPEEPAATKNHGGRRCHCPEGRPWS